MPRDGWFETTRWSLVLAARGDESVAPRALAVLCETYRYPLYAYTRRQGYDVDDARDLTQSFFAQLLERRDLHGVDQARGRLRSFLLASLRHFVLNDRVRERAQKRGGGQIVFPIDVAMAEDGCLRDLADTATPETIFDRLWARTVLDRVLRELKADAHAAGKGDEFERLKRFLIGDLPSGGYKALAADLGSSEGAAKGAVHRLKRRFQRRLRDMIAETVATDEAIDEEIHYLLKALHG